MTEHEQFADNEARHGNREALERMTKELDECRKRLERYRLRSVGKATND